MCGLCAGPCEWISLSILPSPIPELQHAPLPLQVLWAKERLPTPPSSAVFHLGSHLSPSRGWECALLLWRRRIMTSRLDFGPAFHCESKALLLQYGCHWCHESLHCLWIYKLQRLTHVYRSDVCRISSCAMSWFIRDLFLNKKEATKRMHRRQLFQMCICRTSCY